MKKVLWAIIAIIFSSPSAISYRFICNGILASGQERSDKCGVCDVQHAARWNDSQINVVVDDTRLPRGITKDDWQTIVNESFSAWNTISGSSLRFVKSAGVPERDFGAVGAGDNSHEIFFITDKQEWRKLVGSGEFGTLGATLPRYSCDGGPTGNRVIYDADLVLNGLPYINWQVDCHSDDCISVQTTLVHELGHFFGLDHPCLSCSTSIMSARAGFDLTYPVFDDMEGLRVLYPNGATGGLAASCSLDRECEENNLCVNDGINRYCTQSCSKDEDCQFGMLCQENAGKKACVFLDDVSAGGRNEGENCMDSPCIEPLICAGAQESEVFCFKPCESEKDCKTNQECIVTEDATALCVTIKHLNEPCDYRELCDEDLICLLDGLKGKCRAPCDQNPRGRTTCARDEICLTVERDVTLCIPLNEGSSLEALNLDEPRDEFSPPQGQHLEAEDKNLPGMSGCQTGPKTGSNLGWIVASLCFFYFLRKRTKERLRP